MCAKQCHSAGCAEAACGDISWLKTEVGRAKCDDSSAQEMGNVDWCDSVPQIVGIIDGKLRIKGSARGA